MCDSFIKIIIFDINKKILKTFLKTLLNDTYYV